MPATRSSLCLACHRPESSLHNLVRRDRVSEAAGYDGGPPTTSLDPLLDPAEGSEPDFRRAVLRLFVRRELMDVETAQGMLAWPHSGFHVQDGVWVAADDRELAERLACYCSNLRN